jgi:hypothetical protein
MTHVLPPHPQLDIRSSEGQDSVQQMDQQPHIDTQQSQQSPAQATPPQGRKRKKAENGEPSTPAEPRRLRRSHEACARCRSKKIKVGTISRNSSSLGPLARRGKSRRSTPPAISLATPTRFFPFLPPPTVLLLTFLFILTVRLQTSQMHRLCNRRNYLSPRRQTSSDSHPPRPH